MSTNTTPFITSLSNLEVNCSQNSKRQVPLLLPDALRMMKQAEDNVPTKSTTTPASPAQPTTGASSTSPAQPTTSGSPASPAQPTTGNQGISTKQPGTSKSPATSQQSVYGKRIPIISSWKSGPASSRYIQGAENIDITSNDMRNIADVLEYAKVGLSFDNFSVLSQLAYGFTYAHSDAETSNLPEGLHSPTLATSLQYPYSRYFGIGPLLRYVDTPPQISVMFMPYNRRWFADTVVPKTEDGIMRLRDYIGLYDALKRGGKDPNTNDTLYPDPIEAYGIANAIAQDYTRASIWANLSSKIDQIRNYVNEPVSEATNALHNLVDSYINDVNVPKTSRDQVQNLYSALINDHLTGDASVLAIDSIRLHSLASALSGSRIDSSDFQTAVTSAIQRYSKFLKDRIASKTNDEVKNKFIEALSAPVGEQDHVKTISDRLLYLMVIGPESPRITFNNLTPWKINIVKDADLRNSLFGSNGLNRWLDRYGNIDAIPTLNDYDAAKIQFNSAKYYFKELNLMRLLGSIRAYTDANSNAYNSQIFDQALNNLVSAMTTAILHSLSTRDIPKEYYYSNIQIQ